MVQIELAVDGMYELDFDQTLTMGPRRAGHRPRTRRRRVDRGGRLRAGARRSRIGSQRASAEAPQGGAGTDRSSVRRGVGAAAGGAVLPGLGRELPRALRRRNRARPAGHRDRAHHRSRAPARSDDARPGLPVRDAGADGRGDRDVRDRCRGRAARRQPPLPVLGAVRARLGPLLRGASRCRHRRVRREPARRRAPDGWHDAVGRRRPRLGARRMPVRGRQPGGHARDDARARR